MIYDGWELLRDSADPARDRVLGSGGQGTVYLARSPARALARRSAAERVRGLLRQLSSGDYEPTELARCLSILSNEDPFEDLGALKMFAVPSGDKNEETKALGRLDTEIHALEHINHPSVLKLLHSNLGSRFIVTEYHSRGPLSANLERYVGDPVAALQAFRMLVQGVVEIHEQGAIHRDIKPENIFLAASGTLVLGDFGIVFFRDGVGERLTSTYGERVGSHFWMAPWAYDNVRLHFSEVKPSLDIYPLGKVLWSMISGRDGFPYWEFDRPENNLQAIFPEDPAMPLVNGLIGKCVVREEKDCISRGVDLVAEVDRLLVTLLRIGQKPDDDGPWPCRMCGRGRYVKTSTVVSGYVELGADRTPLRVFACDRCGHAELFEASNRYR